MALIRSSGAAGHEGIPGGQELRFLLNFLSNVTMSICTDKISFSEVLAIYFIDGKIQGVDRGQDKWFEIVNQ